MTSEDDNFPINISEVATPEEGNSGTGLFDSDEELTSLIQKKVPADNSTNTSETDNVQGTQECPVTDIGVQETRRVSKGTSSTQQLSSIFELDDNDILNQEPDQDTLNFARPAVQTGDAQVAEQEDTTEKGYDHDMFDEDSDEDSDVSNIQLNAKQLKIS